MEELILRVSEISKHYKIGQIGSTTLREELQRKKAKLLKRDDPTIGIGMEKRSDGDFYALKDVSFDVKRGEKIGIIGHNGAGKSTLLKLISQITAPTSGYIGLNGRIASMLEVGTGFHGELTGRENIYMNGAILGMKKKDIDKIINQIIEFSECEYFIDTPVKRYSSGMYVKLAFAVAAHLKADLMIMDEVLSVGDLAYQKKCISKMKEISDQENRAVLCVSHNMNTIRELCNRCIVLDHGKIIFDGDVNKAIHLYSGSNNNTNNRVINLEDYKRSWINGIRMRFLNLEILNKEAPYIEYGEELSLKIVIKAKDRIEDMKIHICIQDIEDNAFASVFSKKSYSLNAEEKTSISLKMKTNQIVPGKYNITLAAYEFNKNGTPTNLDLVTYAYHFEIRDQYGKIPYLWNESWGSMLLEELLENE